MESIKLNSNTFSLGKEDHKTLEGIITKVAAEAGVQNVESINISMTADRGVVQFKEATSEEESEDSSEDSSDWSEDSTK